MASDSEGVPYDDDFEEASDDEGGTHKSLHGVLRRDASSASHRRKEEAANSVAAPSQVSEPPNMHAAAMPFALSSHSAEVGGQPSVMEATSRPGSRPGRRRQAEDTKATTKPSEMSVPPIYPTDPAPVSSRPLSSSRRRQAEDTKSPIKPSEMSVFEDTKPKSKPNSARAPVEEPVLEMNISQGSFGTSGASAGGRRPVRAKISVGGTDESLDRRPGTTDSAGKSSTPIWLQSDASRPLPRHMSPNQGDPARGFGARSNSGDRGPNPPSSASGTGRSRPPVDPDFDADARLGTADDDRKVKRLQQEIQRLTARLKEAELFSAQDEGLPLFTLDEIDVGCQIGQGGFCSVHHTMWRSTACAVKKIFDPVITEELKAEFENEVRMLRRLRHPNVITIMAVCRVPPALSILTEFVGGGSLFELLHGPPQAKRRDSPDCEPASLLPVMHQLSGALAYLHGMLVAHRDIKSHNVLLTPGQVPVAKLCDFGLARPKSELCTGTMQWAGTACYMAPELFAKRRYTEAVDVFAFGVMLWEVMSTEIPHANLEPADIAHRVQSKDGAGLPVQHGWPKSLKALLRTSMAVQSEERPSMISVGDQLQPIILEFPPPD